MEQDKTGENILSYLKEKELLDRIEKLEEELSKKDKGNVEEKYTHVEQILILDYLGIGKNINTDTQKAKLYGPIIKRDIETTRQKLSSLGYYKNDKESLRKIKKVFENAGLKDYALLVQKDIDR